MERMRYRSRVSMLYIPILGVTLFFIWWLGDLFPKEYVPLGSFFRIFIRVTVGITSVLFLLTIYSTYYILTDKEIQVHFMGGIWVKSPACKILISSITSVERSYNPINAPALSLKRLRLRFKFERENKWDEFYMGLPLISPVREQEFLETLKNINPNIQINVNDKKGWWRFWDWDF